VRSSSPSRFRRRARQSNLVQDKRPRATLRLILLMEQLEIVEIGAPAETREFSLGRFELYRIGGRESGRAVYAPGWRWSERVRPIGDTDCRQAADTRSRRDRARPRRTAASRPRGWSSVPASTISSE
jgi:hypothetical protein